MTNAWSDFNDADSQNSFDLIPKGSIAPVRMSIRPGGYDDPAQGWTGGFATRNQTTGAVYLNCEFVITEGPHAKRKVWSLIGLYSTKGPDWGHMGRSMIRAILNSSHGLADQDISPEAQAVRRIAGFADLDGIEFLARIDVTRDQNGDEKNEIRLAVTPDHKDWRAFLDSGGQWRPGRSTVSAAPATVASVSAAQYAAPAETPAANPTRPTWAQ